MTQGCVAPTGVANPDVLRAQSSAVQFVKGSFDAGKTVVVVYHWPRTIVEANLVRGPDHCLLAEPEDLTSAKLAAAG